MPFEERKHVGAWMVPSFDPELNLVYIGTSVTSPAPKFMLGGADLVSCPTIAFTQFAAPWSRQGGEPPPFFGRYRASRARKGSPDRSQLCKGISQAPH